MIYIDPSSFEVTLHPSIHEDDHDAGRLFVDSTFERLRLPADSRLRPSPEMFEKRYDWFGEAYSWAR